MMTLDLAAVILGGGPTVGGAAVMLLIRFKGIASDAPIYGGLGLSLVIYLGLSLREGAAGRRQARGGGRSLNGC
jgi:hypothetical protein